MTGVEVYCVTDRSLDGSTVHCTTDEVPLSLATYEIVLRASGEGAISYRAWIDAVGFSNGILPFGDNTMIADQGYVWIGRLTLDPIGPGTHRLGTLFVSVSGSPRLDFATSIPLPQAGGRTYFGTHCLSNQFDQVFRLGDDYFDGCGTEAPESALASTWNRIQRLYR